MRNLIHKIAVLLLVSLFVFPQTLSAATNQILADSQDVFYVVSPAPNSVVRGNVNTTWRVYDNDQTAIPYDLSLFDSATCAHPVARISYGNSNSSKTANNAVSWSSSGPLLNVSHLADGPYCLQLCVSLRNGAGSYSACNLRVITVRNNNRAPSITTNPPSNNNISTTGTWQYDVNATDPDGDAILFSLSGQPSFISINQNTGLIYLNSNARVAGTYNMTVKATDLYGGSASQNFSLIVSAPASNSSSSASSSSSSSQSSSSSSEAANQATEIEITSPVATTEYKGKTNKITWTASDADGIKLITLSYSTDGKNWIKINDIAPTQTEYDWDVEFIKDGSYFVKVDVTDNTGEVTSAISAQFSVNNAALNPGDQTNVGKPLITSVQPGEGAQTTELKPTITGQFTAPASSTIDTKSFSLSIDDNDISSQCTVEADKFSCALTTELTSGLHKVNAQIKDSKSQQGSKEWTFAVSTTTEQKPAEATLPILGNVSANSVKILLIVCILLLLLLLIPWILVRIWKRRKDNEANAQTETSPGELPYATPEITTNYYYPGTDTSSNPSDYNYSFGAPTATSETAIPTDNYVQAPQPAFETTPAPAEASSNPILPSSMDVSTPSWLTPQNSSSEAAVAPSPEATPVVPAPTKPDTADQQLQSPEPLSINPVPTPTANDGTVTPEPLLPQPSDTENGSFGSYGYGKQNDG